MPYGRGFMFKMRLKGQVATREACTDYAYLVPPLISVSWDDTTGLVEIVCASLTVVSTIRTNLLWNKFCDKNQEVR